MTRQLVITLMLAAGVLTGCSVARLPFAYVPDVRQGTVLSQEAVDQLRTGMSRRQVQFLLGSPPLVDPFHENRWDYVEALKPGNGDFRSRRVTVFFEDDRLTAVEGDLQPQDQSLRRGG